MGGPMMGFTLLSQDIPVVKTTNCILAPTVQEMPAPSPAQACIRCGMCAEACPVSLLPQQMYWFAQSKNHDALKEHHLFDCIECGACSFACPSSIPLVQYYRASKADIRKTEADQKKSEYSRERYEARLARLEKADAEKEAKRKERQNKAGDNTPKTDTTTSSEKTEVTAASSVTPATSDDPVQAAIERAKAKAAGNAAPVDPVADAQAKISALQTRLKKAEEKLVTAQANNDSNLDAFIGSVEKLKEKLAEAKAVISAPVTVDAINTETAAVIAEDPIQAAIERAKARRENADNVDPKTKLLNDIVSLEKRIATTQEKIKTAEAESSDTIDVLKTSLVKLQDKLDAAKQQLDQLG